MRRTAVSSMLRQLILCTAVFFVCVGSARSAQQYQGLCSYIKIEILQELTLERVGFLATLKVTNNEGDASITGFSASLTFAYPQLDAQGNAVDASPLFFVQPPELKGISTIDGSGIIPPGQTAEVSWFIIPKVTAGGEDPGGLRYSIGASLAGLLYGKEIPPDVLTVIPDTITVKPDPQLEITYFQPRDVDGDNPFTPEVVESPIPFTLGVLVKNAGYGTARKIKIDSQQPRIVENLQGLLVVPRLIGSRVEDNPTDYSSLSVDVGDIEPGRCRKAAWDMITTLSGEFTEFKASYTHAQELGGRDTSLIKSLNAYFIVHEVLNDQPGRDKLKDFLAVTTNPADLIPDALYETDCNVLPVNRLTDVQVGSYAGLTARIDAVADIENWVYLRLDDPAQARLNVAKVVRSDGKTLNPNNYWTHVRYQPHTNARLAYLNIFDFVALGQYSYTVTYESGGSDSTPPVTRLLFSGPYEESNGKIYVLPETQLFFIADDESPVSITYRLDGGLPSGDFLPAYPFNIETAGEHTLEFHSLDSSGNQETTQTKTIVLADGYPSFVSVEQSTNELFIPGNSVSVRPMDLTVTIDGLTSAASLTAEADVFRGAYGRPSLAGIPSSPTPHATASITVSGENADFYRYRLGGGPWSAEFAVADPIVLGGLSGTVQLSVKARSRNGNYHPDAEAITATWTVDPAQSLAVSGIPATPTQRTDAQLAVSGTSWYCYRVDGNFYRPNLTAGAPIVLGRLGDGEHRVEVLTRGSSSESCPASGAAVTARWTVDREYGLRFPAGTLVRHAALGPVSGPVNFVWDGRDNDGVIMQNGWYSVRMTLRNGLGRTSGVVRQVYVGDLLPDGYVVSAPGSSAQQREAQVAGRWLVWQDQRSGNWDIYALDLSSPAATPVAVADTVLSQEWPRTDGTYVVWEDRQADGTWDIKGRLLGSPEGAFAVTATPGSDEKRPSVHYPWVVFQRKPISSTTPPWQVIAYNMIDHTETVVDATAQDQLDPVVQGQRVVWQDFRDAGFGEIYMGDLKAGAVVRITNDPGGQYHPGIVDNWIVWADNRNTQFDLYGYNLLRGAEVRLTQTPENETRPALNGQWVVYEEDAGGVLMKDLRILHLSNLASVQLTNMASNKEKPSFAAGRLAWTDYGTGLGRVMVGTMPDLQPVFNNRNAVVVTRGMATYQQDARSLLSLWQREAGVQSISRYETLLPEPVAQTMTWQDGAPAGTDFALTEGGFVWVKFADGRILDLGLRSCGPVSLVSGVNALSYPCFPDRYSAYRIIRELGSANVAAVRMLDAQTGRWSVAVLNAGTLVGEDFTVPPVAVLLIEMHEPVTDWTPGQ